ncbi:hypothetical protein L1887_42169 [Cichorium endivia]|nr:hypothetical protein L1887_42169 [Cichorium endivia]
MANDKAKMERAKDTRSEEGQNDSPANCNLKSSHELQAVGNLIFLTRLQTEVPECISSFLLPHYKRQTSWPGLDLGFLAALAASTRVKRQNEWPRLHLQEPHSVGVESILFAAPCVASPDVTSRGGTLQQFHLSIRLCAAGRAVTGAELGGSRFAALRFDRRRHGCAMRWNCNIPLGRVDVSESAESAESAESSADSLGRVGGGAEQLVQNHPDGMSHATRLPTISIRRINGL